MGHPDISHPRRDSQLRVEVLGMTGSESREAESPVTIFWFFVWSLLKTIVVTVVFLMGVAYTVLLERKLVARIQHRWGPSRVGPFRLLQPLVDGAKSFLKEAVIPTSVYKPLYLLAPLIALRCALISISVLPFGAPGLNYHGFRFFQISDLNI